MKCPYCNMEMVLGELYGADCKAVYWLPIHAEQNFAVLTRKNIGNQEGVILDQITKIGFFVKERPRSYYCKNCKIILTQLQ